MGTGIAAGFGAATGREGQAARAATYARVRVRARRPARSPDVRRDPFDLRGECPDVASCAPQERERDHHQRDEICDSHFADRGRPVRLSLRAGLRLAISDQTQGRQG